MKTEQYINQALVFMLFFGIVLFLLPWSVNSQEGITSFIDDETSSDMITYTIEKIDGVSTVQDFVVGPGKFDIVLEPGESKTVPMIVTNRMGEPKIFTIEIEDIKGSRDDDQAVVLLGDDRGPHTLKDYIQIPHMEFTLNYMERATIPVTVSIPLDAEPGGRYGSVLISIVSFDQNLNDISGTTPTSVIVSRIGTLFFISVPGSIDVHGELIAFETISNKQLFTSGPINFELVFENTGSLHLNPYGEISILNMTGNEVGLVEISPWFSLPQSLRTREISWDQEFMIGRYTAIVRINRGYDDIIDESTLTFWVIPWKPLLIIFVTLLVIFLLLRFLSTRFEFKRKK